MKSGFRSDSFYKKIQSNSFCLEYDYIDALKRTQETIPKRHLKKGIKKPD